MSVFTQDEFDGGMLGSKGMYRNSSLKNKAVKRAINAVPTDEGTLRSRPLANDIPYDPYIIRTRSLKDARPEIVAPLTESLFPGVRTLPFTWRGDKYVLHYTPFHYLTLDFDLEGYEVNSVNPYEANQRTVMTNITTMRQNLEGHIDSGFLRSISEAAVRQFSPLYNLLYTREQIGPNVAEARRYFASVDWTRSTFLYNVYVVIREDGTVVRQGRPFPLRSVVPEGAIPESFVTRNLAGGRSKYLHPTVSGDGEFITGTHEIEAALTNHTYMTLGGMTLDEIRTDFAPSAPEGSPLSDLPVWSGALYERYFRPNVRYEFVDLGDTFTFVDAEGTVPPDITHGKGTEFAQGVYFPVTTSFAGDEGFPFPYDGRQEVLNPSASLSTTIQRPAGSFETDPLEEVTVPRDPLLMPSFNQEKGEETRLAPLGFPGAPIPTPRFNPGRVYFRYGAISQVVRNNSKVATYVENTHNIDLDFADARTGTPLEATLHFGGVNSNLHPWRHVKAEIVGGRVLRLTTQSENGRSPADFRTRVGTDAKRLGLVARRPSSVYVDNSPRVRLPGGRKAYFVDTPVAQSVETAHFFHGPIINHFRGFYDGSLAEDSFLGIGFHMVFTSEVDRNYLEGFTEIVLRRTYSIGTAVFTDYLTLTNPEIYTLPMRQASSRPNRPAGFPAQSDAPIAATANYEGILGSDVVLFFPASNTANQFSERSFSLRSGAKIPLAEDNEMAALGDMIGTQASRNTFHVEMYTSEESEAYPRGRPFWSGYHVDEYAELQINTDFITTSAASAPDTQTVYLPSVDIGARDVAQYERIPHVRWAGYGTTAQYWRTYTVANAGASVDELQRTGFYTFPLENYLEQCQFILRSRVQGTSGGMTVNQIGEPEETPFRLIGRVFGDSPSSATFAYRGLEAGTPFFAYTLFDADNTNPTQMILWPKGLAAARGTNASILNAFAAGAVRGREPEDVTLQGALPHKIRFTDLGGTEVTNEGSLYFPIRIFDEDILRQRFRAWTGVGPVPGDRRRVEATPYYSRSLLERNPEETAELPLLSRYTARICLRTDNSEEIPVPLYFNLEEYLASSRVRYSGREMRYYVESRPTPPVLEEARADFIPLLAREQNIPQIWRVYQGRFFWFARRSFGASALLDFGDFNSYERNVTEGPLALRLAGDNLIPTGQDDTHIHWAYVYEGNLLIGMNTQIRILSRDNPFTGGQIPTTLVRLPSTNITPVYVRNFLFKVRGDLKGIERVVPTFQYGQRIISTTISNPVALDYLDDATIEYMIEHPTDHVFYVGTSDDRILYGHVSPDGIVSWSELDFPDRVGPLQRNSFGVFYRTATNLLRFITGEGVPVESDLTCEIELLPLSLLGRRQTGRLNEGSQQGDASVIVDMPEGEELHLGRGQTIRSRVVYSGGEIRESYRESPEGDEGMLLRYIGSGPFHLIRVAREDNTIIDPRQLFFRQYRPDPRLLGLKEI